MSGTLHKLTGVDVAQLQQLQGLLDETETDRTRVNRRIRRLRSLIKAVREGEPIEDLELQIAALPAVRATMAAVTASAAVAASAPAAPPTAVAPPAPSAPFQTPLGEGLPAGVAAPGPAPAAGESLDMPSVDVGRLGRMSPEQLDRLPFGVVTLDSNGRVIAYNDTESRLAGLPRESVLGRNFFGDVAPCTAVREFEGRFRDFAAGRTRMALETFEFVFNFRHGAQRVVIMISPARIRGQFHVSMIRR